MPDRNFSDQELDAALHSIAAPGRLREAQNVVLRSAPSLQRLLATALAEGGWFDLGHTQAVRQAVGTEDPLDREREVQTLVAEETRLGMMVGVAVGFELARELDRLGRPEASGPGPDRPEASDPDRPTVQTESPDPDRPTVQTESPDPDRPPVQTEIPDQED